MIRKHGRTLCLSFAALHLAALAISTYIAAIEIRSILVTGFICSTTGILAALFARQQKQNLLLMACMLTPIIAIVLFLLEVTLLELGAGKAALPFCIVFIINQVISTLAILVLMNLMASKIGDNRTQITIRTLFVAMTSFCVFFAVASQLLKASKHNWMMGIALGLLGLTIVGLSVTLVSIIANRRQTSSLVEASDEDLA